jgi:glycosyltransferase involved in cell wall biosynthesis
VTRIRQILKYFSTRIPIWFQQTKNIIRKEGLIIFFKKLLGKLYRFFLHLHNPHKLHRIQYAEWQRNIEQKYLNKNYMSKLMKKMQQPCGEKRQKKNQEISTKNTQRGQTEKKTTKKQTNHKNNKAKNQPPNKNLLKFSILLPTWNKTPEMTQACLDSIKNQFYENWEVCISEGSSKYRKETEEVVQKFKKLFPNKVKLDYLNDELRNKINIIENRNNCLRMASGEYIVYMDSDDELAPNALLELAWEIKQNPDTAFIYSDFDKIDTEGNRFDPSFWPDWSPHTILSMMYTTHIRCFKTELVRKLDGMRKGTEGGDDWDLVLRVAEQVEPKQIRHIPKILYHWRVYRESTSLSGSGAKDWAYKNQKKVLEDWMERNNEEGEVLEGTYAGSWRIKFDIKNKPKVSIIIPFRDEVKYLKQCLPSIEEKTKYKNYEVVLVDNQSEKKATLDYLEKVKDKYKILKYDKPYSFGNLNNWAAKKVDGEHILMLNNDTEVLNEGWLSTMLEYSQRDEVGAVGAKLLYPNNKIQHAGIIVGLGGAAAHSHRLLWAGSMGYNGWLVNVMNFMAVTGACLMIKRQLFLDEMGGFDPVFDPAYQDVDLGIRLYEAGYWNVYTPYAKLKHYESVTRFNKKNKAQLEKDEENAEKLRKRWPKYVGINFCGDPFYNPNLSCGHEDFRMQTDWGGQEWGEKVGLVKER